MSRSHKAKSYFPLTGIFLALTLFIERASAVQNAENADLESLLYQAREEAVGLDRDADEMEMLVRSIGRHMPYIWIDAGGATQGLFFGSSRQLTRSYPCSTTLPPRQRMQ